MQAIVSDRGKGIACRLLLSYAGTSPVQTGIKFLACLIPVFSWRKAFRNRFAPLSPDARRKQQIEKEVVDFWKTKSKKETRGPVLTCPLCQFSSKRKQFERLRSECAFGGGRLTRYRCPGCGVIFGPFKMLNLTEDELAMDYRRHYLLYSEGDSVAAQIEAFYKLNPKKAGNYLNYGSGNSEYAIKALKAIRADGYNILGYDPYARVMDNALSDCLITKREKLEKHKFDGIITHNVLEHLFHPIETTDFLLRLLNPGATLIHSTACFDYCYEYSRFHVFFFTGKSVEVLAEKLGATVYRFTKAEMNHMHKAVAFRRQD